MTPILEKAHLELCGAVITVPSTWNCFPGPLPGQLLHMIHFLSSKVTATERSPSPLYVSSPTSHTPIISYYCFPNTYQILKDLADTYISSLPSLDPKLHDGRFSVPYSPVCTINICWKGGQVVRQKKDGTKKEKIPVCRTTHLPGAQMFY